MPQWGLIETFQVTAEPLCDSRNEADVDVARVEVNVVDHSTTPQVKFSIDVPADLPLIAAPQRHFMTLPTLLAGYPSQVSIALHLMENQLANKVMTPPCRGAYPNPPDNQGRTHEPHDRHVIMPPFPRRQAS